MKVNCVVNTNKGLKREELLKIAKPILFNTEMTQAILENKKTVTRRIVKPQPPEGYIFAGTLLDSTGREDTKNIGKIAFTDLDFRDSHYCKQPYQVGDILYVRETWCKNGSEYLYKAGCPHLQNNMYIKWKPSIHMPKEAARLFLKVTDVRAERLQDITDEECIAEGIKPVRVPGSTNYREEREFQIACGIATIEKYAELWNSTIKTDAHIYDWKANPWVWVIEFEKISPMLDEHV